MWRSGRPAIVLLWSGMELHRLVSLLSLIASEYQRLEESRGLRADDQTLIERLRASSAPLPSKILARADRLAEARWGEGWQTTLRSRLRWVMGLACLLVAMAGAATASLALGDGRVPANVLWLGAALLALPTFMLGLWLLSLLWRPNPHGPWMPRWLAGLSLRWAGVANAEQLFAASAGLLRGSQLPRWGLSLLSHALWLAWLLGALIGLAWAMSLRRYDFVWETTLLAPGWLPQWIEWLSAWPTMLGFVGPDRAEIEASAIHPAGAADIAQRWAQWTIGMLVAYGLIPRLVALLFTAWRFAVARRRLALDLSLPYYLGLAERLAPTHQRIEPEQVVAPVLPRFRVEAPVAARESASGRSEVLCLECDPPEQWRSAGTLPIERVESREERRVVLARLARSPVAKLLVLVDPRLSPDRSSLGLLAELSQHAGKLRVGLLQAASEERLSAWRAELQAIGLAPEDCLDQSQAAWQWIAGASHDL